MIGVGKDFQNIPFMHLSSKEIDLRFQYRYHDTYPRAIDLVSEGLIDLKPLVTRKPVLAQMWFLTDMSLDRYTLEEGVEAFTTASTPAARAIKVQVLDD